MRLLCSAGPASGDTADTAADTVGTSAIGIAGNGASAGFFRRVMRSSRVLVCGCRRHAGDVVCLGLRLLSCVRALEVAVGVHGDVLHRLQRMARLLVGIDVVHGWAPWRPVRGVNENVHTS